MMNFIMYNSKYQQNIFPCFSYFHLFLNQVFTKYNVSIFYISKGYMRL